MKARGSVDYARAYPYEYRGSRDGQGERERLTNTDHLGEFADIIETPSEYWIRLY